MTNIKEIRGEVIKWDTMTTIGPYKKEYPGSDCRFLEDDGLYLAIDWLRILLEELDEKERSGVND